MKERKILDRIGVLSSTYVDIDTKIMGKRKYKNENGIRLGSKEEQRKRGTLKMTCPF
jgi:hypothetical protein